MKYLAAAVMLTVAFVMGGANLAGEKVTIKDVMGKAMKGKDALCGKVASGKASDAEKKELVELFTALSKNTPPKGDAESWKKKTTALVEAAKKAAAGDADAGKALKAAANCNACHGEHKGK